MDMECICCLGYKRHEEGWQCFDHRDRTFAYHFVTNAQSVVILWKQCSLPYLPPSPHTHTHTRSTSLFQFNINHA
jgi:hypothetical protein